jgi:autocrine motility factor receptor
VAVHLLTLLHHLHVWVLHGLSFHLLDALLLLDTRAVVLSFLQRLQAHMVHRAATLNLDHTFPDAGDGSRGDCGGGGAGGEQPYTTG